MKLAIYKSNDWKSAEEAEKHGALYEMKSDFTYSTYTGLADATEVIEMCQRCHSNEPVQIVVNRGGGWNAIDI